MLTTFRVTDISALNHAQVAVWSIVVRRIEQGRAVAPPRCTDRGMHVCRFLNSASGWGGAAGDGRSVRSHLSCLFRDGIKTGSEGEEARCRTFAGGPRRCVRARARNRTGK